MIRRQPPTESSAAMTQVRAGISAPAGHLGVDACVGLAGRGHPQWVGMHSHDDHLQLPPASRGRPATARVDVPGAMGLTTLPSLSRHR